MGGINCEKPPINRLVSSSKIYIPNECMYDSCSTSTLCHDKIMQTDKSLGCKHKHFALFCKGDAIFFQKLRVCLQKFRGFFCWCGGGDRFHLYCYSYTFICERYAFILDIFAFYQFSVNLHYIGNVVR